jgi:hypothetical protein
MARFKKGDKVKVTTRGKIAFPKSKGVGKVTKVGSFYYNAKFKGHSTQEFHRGELKKANKSRKRKPQTRRKKNSGLATALKNMSLS